MPKHWIAYVNGRYLPQWQASVSVDDRGYQFADGVYEVMNLVNGALLDGGPHFDRLDYSLELLKISRPVSVTVMTGIIRELARRNRVADAMVYLQITRGAAARNHVFPSRAIKPSLVITLSPLKTPALSVYEKGVKAVTLPDIRWKMCNAKTTSLLANVLLKQQAKEAGALDAILYDEAGMVTEGGACNVFIVDKLGVLVTHPKDAAILPGITRDVLLALADANGVRFHERAFSLGELKSAQEAFFTSTTMGAMPVVSIDGVKVGNGKPGALTRKLNEWYDTHVRDQCGVGLWIGD